MRTLFEMDAKNYFAQTPAIRCAEAADYGSVEAIMQEVQQLHVGWRPDIYKPADPVYSRD